MVSAFLIGMGAAALFALVLLLAGLITDRGAGAMSIFVVASLYPVFSIASGGSSFITHLAILAAFVAVAVLGFVIAPRLIAVAVLGHAVFDLYSMAMIGENTPWWIYFCCGFDVILGTIYLRTLGSRT